MLLSAAPVYAAERGSVIRAGDLKAKPYIDAATSAKLTANQQVDIVSRQGAWVQVQAGGTTGWVRMLNLRMAEASGKPTARQASLLRTGSSGKTVTTGIKGVNEEDIKNATVNYAELQRLGTLAVPPAEASANAQQSGLKESKVAYLNKEDGK
jgi:hypothetical protein